MCPHQKSNQQSFGADDASTNSCTQPGHCLYFLCCTSHPCDHFLVTNLYFPILSPFAPNSTTLLPSSKHQCVFCIYESVCTYCVCLYYSWDSTYKCSHRVFVLLLLISLGIIPFRSNYAVISGKLHSFLWPGNIPLYICSTSFFPLFYWWALGLLPYLGDCKLCRNEQRVHIVFHISALEFLWYIPRSGIAGS